MHQNGRMIVRYEHNPRSTGFPLIGSSVIKVSQQALCIIKSKSFRLRLQALKQLLFLSKSIRLLVYQYYILFLFILQLLLVAIYKKFIFRVLLRICPRNSNIPPANLPARGCPVSVMLNFFLVPTLKAASYLAE